MKTRGWRLFLYYYYAITILITEMLWEVLIKAYSKVQHHTVIGSMK